MAGIAAEPFPRDLVADVDPGAAAVGERLGDFLVQALDAVGIVGMDHRAGARIVDQRDVLLDRVIAFHLEAVPVGPHHRANVVVAQQIGDLVGFDGVVERGDVIAELLRHIDHLRHLVGAVAMVLDEDLALEHALQRVHREVALRHVAAVAVIFVPLALVGLGLDPRRAGQRDIAHPRLRHVALRAIDPLGILAARHLEAVRRAGELHSLRRSRGHVLQHDRAAAEQIGRAGQDLQRRHAAVDQRAAEKPGSCGHTLCSAHTSGRTGDVASLPSDSDIDAGRGIIAEVAVDVDDRRA